MLQQSQTQFTALDRKYSKAKRLVREYQQREVDMVRFENIIELHDAESINTVFYYCTTVYLL